MSETKTPVGYGEPAYTIRVERLDYAGRKQIVEFDSYGVLRELLADIEAHPEVQAWLKESDPDEGDWDSEGRWRNPWPPT